jgi:hypothetical protein
VAGNSANGELQNFVDRKSSVISARSRIRREGVVQLIDQARLGWERRFGGSPLRIAFPGEIRRSDEMD